MSSHMKKQIKITCTHKLVAYQNLEEKKKIKYHKIWCHIKGSIQEKQLAKKRKQVEKIMKTKQIKI